MSQPHTLHSIICIIHAGSSDEVEIKDQLIKIETVDQQVQAGETVQQQGVQHSWEYWFIVEIKLHNNWVYEAMMQDWHLSYIALLECNKSQEPICDRQKLDAFFSRTSLHEDCL